MRKIVVLMSVMICLMAAGNSDACTGIALTAADGSRVVARTMDRADTAMQPGYVVAPRRHLHQSLTPTGKNGLKYKSLYGYVGIFDENQEFVYEGVNEAGLSAGLFFFPQYGEYAPYNSENNAATLCDMQFVSWVLSQFSSIDQVVDTLPSIDVVSLGTDAPCLHWRISEPCGRIVILEFIAGEPHFYEDPTGVLTNGPGFQWQRANLYDTSSFVPGDSASQSRFVRATYMQAGSPEMRTGPDAIQQAFHILNNFDVPVGIQYAISETADVLPSATQIISATDQTALKLYYRTVWNSTIRCIELMNIDFAKVRYQSHPLDRVMQPVVEIVKVK